MVEQTEIVPMWFLPFVGSVIMLLLAIIAFFIIRFIKTNDNAWDAIRDNMSELITNVKILTYKTQENEDDIRELQAARAGRPYVKQQRNGGKD